MAREEVNARVLNDIYEVVQDPFALTFGFTYLTSILAVNPPVCRKEGEKRERQRKRNGDLYLNLKKYIYISKNFVKVEKKNQSFDGGHLVLSS